MNKYLLPLQRETWEHFGSFIKMPIIVLAILSLLLLISSIGFGERVSSAIGGHENFNIGENFSAFDDDNQSTRTFQFKDKVIGEVKTEVEKSLPDFGDRQELYKGLRIGMQTPYVIFHGLMLLVAFSFLLACLMADRKDGSILFWKSMPVSESQTVLTKLFAAIVLLPAIAWLAAFAMSFIILISGLILALFSGIDQLPTLILRQSSVIATGWDYLGTFLAISLWLLPVAAWTLCASAAAKKNAFLTAVLPAILIVIVEKYLSGTSYFAGAFFQHMSGLVPESGKPFMLLQPSWSQLSSVLGSTQFWIALPISAALIYASIWFRENRYENE